MAIFLGLGLTISLTAPLIEGSDQIAHFEFIRFIAKHGRLPVNTVERSEAGYKSDLPPLFHLLVGLTGSHIDLASPPFVKLTDHNPRLQLVFGSDDLGTSRVLTTEDPYLGEVLLWYLGRWATLLFGAMTFVPVYLLLRSIYLNTPWLILGSISLLAFTPTYVLNSGVISYEPLLGLWLAFYFLLLHYTIQHPNKIWLYLGLGLFLGLATLTKYTPFPAVLILPLVSVWLIYRRHWTWRTTMLRLIFFSLGFILTFGSWLFFTVIYFNRVGELGWVNGMISPFLASDASDETSARIMGLFSLGKLGNISSIRPTDSVWQWLWNLVNGIWRNSWLTCIFLSLYALALVGLIRQWSSFSPPNRLWLMLLGLHLAAFMFIPLLRFLVTGQATTGEGHHIFFPAAVPLILLFGCGLSYWFMPQHVNRLLLILAALGVLQSAILVTQIYRQPWPIRTVPLSKDEQVLATFEQLSLTGYDRVATDQVLEITLRWRAEDFPADDYSVELTLLDDTGHAQARWIGQPLNGRYPTRTWEPGDRVSDIIHIPVAGLPRGDYQLRLRLLRQVYSIQPSFHPSVHFSFIPLKPIVARKNDSFQSLPVPIADGLALGRVALTPSPLAKTDTVQLDGFEIGYTLFLEHGPTTTRPVYHERSTLVFITDKQLGSETQLSLIGPDNQPRMPVDHAGYTYNFIVEPHFASGLYHLHFEKRSNNDLVDHVETTDLLQIQTEMRQFDVTSMSHVVMANFAGQVALLGYDLPRRQVQPGGELPITLNWQALKIMGEDLIIFNHLIDEDQKVWGGHDRLARELYRTTLWTPGEIVTDPFNIRVNPRAPAGVYHLLVGLYLPVGGKAVSLPLVQDGQQVDASSVNIGPIKVGNTPPGFTVEAANPHYQLNQAVGDPPNLTLLGYDLNDPVKSNPSHDLTLYWRCESQLPLDYTTFVHIRNSVNDTIAQKDGMPFGGAYPTSLWSPGEIIADKIVVPVPIDLPRGRYQIVVGMYDFQTGQRLVVPGNSANEIKLTDVDIP